MASKRCRLTLDQTQFGLLHVGLAGGQGHGDEYHPDMHDHAAVASSGESSPPLTAHRQAQLTGGGAKGETGQGETHQR